MSHRISISDEVYDYLLGTVEDDHITNADMSEDHDQIGRIIAHRPSFSEVIEHMIEDREEGSKHAESRKIEERLDALEVWQAKIENGIALTEKERNERIDRMLNGLIPSEG